MEAEIDELARNTASSVPHYTITEHTTPTAPTTHVDPWINPDGTPTTTDPLGTPQLVTKVFPQTHSKGQPPQPLQSLFFDVFNPIEHHK